MAALATARIRVAAAGRASVLAVSLLAAVCAAAPLSPTARAEIDELLSRLETSGCAINRNGTWHPAADARAHLLRKLDYLEQRGAVQSAEQFIELAASKSSVSNRPYLIRCKSDPPTETGLWLTAQLLAMRASTHGAAAPYEALSPLASPPTRR